MAKIIYVKGVEGNSLYINDFRVAGPKPWGGGEVLQEWDVEVADIIHAINKEFDPVAKPVNLALGEIARLVLHLSPDTPKENEDG